MSTIDYPDYPPQRNRKHRVTVGDATFIVTSNVNGNTRWIREVHHVRRHRSGSSADVCIYPNGGRKPSATLSSLWAHLGIDPAARWMECAADHPAFPARRSIKTALDQADDARKANAAAAVLVAAGWTWTEGENERWIAPPAQGIDLGRLRQLPESWLSQADRVKSASPSKAAAMWACAKELRDTLTLIDQRDAAPGVGK